MAGANGMKSIAFNMSPNTSAGNYYIDNVSLEVEREKVIGASVKYMASLISNGDMEGDDAANFATKSDQGAIVYEIVDGVGKDGSRGAKITSKGGYADSWESQFWIVSNEVLTEGQKVHVSFDYKADGGCVGTGVDTQAHFGPGEYQHWACAGTVQFTGDWQTYDKEFTVDGSMAGANGMKSIAFNMSPNTSAGAYYIDNVVLEVEKESTGGGIPQSAEEKKDTLTYAMDKWIHGVMDACKDDDGNMLVKAWEVVNEAIGANGQLQHGKADDTENFFWQDYLGDLDYVRTVVKLARQYGGNDLKLFVNDYNLEYDWDASGNKKLESLISWINKWESDGKTVIDGIGSQMHVSCYADADELAKRKELIIKSFKMMAETGKLIRTHRFNYWCSISAGMTVLLRDILFAPPLAYYSLHLACLTLSVLLLCMLTYFYARKDWKSYTKRNLWVICIIDMLIAALYNLDIFLEPTNEYTNYMLTEIWIRPTITYGLVACFVTEVEKK